MMNNNNYSDFAQAALENAKAIASSLDSDEVGTEHVLLGVLAVADSQASKIFLNHIVNDELVDILNKLDGFDAPEDGAGLFFSPRAKAVLSIAKDYAAKLGGSIVNTEHIMLALMSMSDSMAYHYITSALQGNMTRVVKELNRVLSGAPVQKPQQSANDFSNFMISGSINGEPIDASQLFEQFFGDASPQMFTPPPQKGSYKNNSAYAKQRGGSPNSTLPESLAGLGIDLTERARSGKMDPIIGRSEEIERIIQILCRKTKNNPVLIGEPGVGKSAVVEGLAQEVVRGNVPELLKNKIIFSLDIGSLMAGTKYRGSMEEKLKNAITTIVESKNIIVFIDELHTLASAGDDKGEVKPADMLKPYLARGELQTVGATTTDEYRKFIEKDKALERRFQPIMVEPPTVEQTVAILKGLRDNYEAFHKIKITDEAIEAAATLSDRYIMDRFLPDKAIDLIDEAASKAKVSGNTSPVEIKELEASVAKLNEEKAEATRAEDYDKAAKLKIKISEQTAALEKRRAEWKEKAISAKTKIDAEDVAAVVASWTKIPVTKINETEKDRLLKLEEILHKRVVGQDEAIAAVAKAVRRARAGLKSPNKPIGSFIFLGPTGVGKTELCKALAEAMFDDENLIIRMDMSEYMESQSTAKLIGSPPGYVGYDEGGQLTEQVRRKPYSVVLFDEIEKADPDVFNILLQILDDGRLTDSQGRVVSFKNTIIIMTSNVGAANLKQSAKSLGFSDNGGEDGFDKAKMNASLTEALKRKFRPEFLNRIDVISIFQPLSKEQIAVIAGKMLDGVTKKLKSKSISVSFTQNITDYLATNGYDPEYGARPLRRLVEQKIEDSLAEKILEDKIKDGDSVTVDIRDGELLFS